MFKLFLTEGHFCPCTVVTPLFGEMESLANAWDDLCRIHTMSLEACAGIATLLQQDLFSTEPERFTTCGDFKTKATVIFEELSRAKLVADMIKSRLGLS